MDPRLETHRARSVVATGKHDLAPRRLGASKCPLRGPALSVHLDLPVRVPPCTFRRANLHSYGLKERSDWPTLP